MTVGVLLARLLLALVFAVAGAAKLADLAGSRRALEEFGVPQGLARPAAILLPVIEIAIAVALIPVASAWWASVAASALLVVFAAGVTRTLLAGRRPDCHCFGQLYSAPIGWGTLVRNGIMIAVAAFVVAQPSAEVSVLTLAESAASAGTSVWISAALGIVLLGLAIETWLLVEVIRQQGRILLRLDALEARSGAPEAAAATQNRPGLPVGQAAPAFTLPGLFGETMTLDSLRARGKPVLLVFTDPNCGPCEALVPDLVRWQTQYENLTTLALLSRGELEENRAKLGAHGLNLVLLQKDREVSQSYGEVGTPSAVLLQPDGTIASTLAQGADQIQALVAQFSAPAVPANGNGAPAATGVRQGERLPALNFPDLAGKTVDLAGFRGRDTMLLFWNPGCGFCQQMVDDVKALEARSRSKGLRLVLVSAGTVEANLANGFRSPVLLDQSFAAGRALGIAGTPSAVLVDRDGKIASEVAVGAPAVLELAASRAA